ARQGWPNTKDVPALLAAAIASTALLMAANARVTTGTLSRMTAVAKVTTSATAACLQATPRRSSLPIQAIASRAQIPHDHWRLCLGLRTCCTAAKNAPRNAGGQRRGK